MANESRVVSKVQTAKHLIQGQEVFDCSANVHRLKSTVFTQEKLKTVSKAVFLTISLQLD